MCGSGLTNSIHSSIGNVETREPAFRAIENADNMPMSTSLCANSHGALKFGDLIRSLGVQRACFRIDNRYVIEGPRISDVPTAAHG